RSQSMRRSCFALFLAFATTGYSGQGEPNRGPESAPSDVKLTIQTHGRQSVFQIGEKIELELLFTSSAPKKYLVVASDVTSRISPAGRIAVAPLTGWEDPVGDFNQLCPVMTFMSVLGGTLPLSRKPIILSLTLNDWVRFKDPGQY